MDNITVTKAISEEGWVIQLSLAGAGLELSLEEAQVLVQELVEEFKEIVAIEEDNNG